MNISEVTTNPEKQLLDLASQELSARGLKAGKIAIARLSKQKHLRIENSIQDIERVVKSIGAGLSYDNIPNLSGKFTSFAITFPQNYKVQELAGQTVYGLSNLKENTKVAQKQLTPVRFGLSGKTFKKAELVSTLQKTIPGTIEDQVLQQFLLQLVDVASGVRSAVDPEVMASIDADTLRITGIDFGEVLTPLVMTEGNEQITFPAGNSMLADVEIDNRPISVKSASGSGTSFRAIQNYMDQFQKELQAGTVTLDQDETEIHNFFRTFVDTQGNNIDKIIAASAVANTDEHQMLEQLLGKKDFTYDDLVKFSSRFKSYGAFLKKIYPVATAGGYAKPNGMPADYQYYMGLSDKQPKVKQAGKPSWDADQGKAGANILTYVLGTSFLADAKKEVKTQKYEELIKRILGSVNATLAKIDITPNGQINLVQRPFSEMNYKFQYHAPSHIPGNNLPGFTLVLD